ncbi:Lymphocyte cytosolic protein 2, partial [Struthio camelus australis]
FQNMSENDIQKFPKLRVPIISKLSQEINRNEGRISFFPKCILLLYSSFTCTAQDEDDDYESPDDDPEKEDEADYESPTEEPEEADHDSDGYEPPPSNNDEAHHNVIFPAKSLANNTDYIDRPSTARSSNQPPIPPQRPGPSPVPAPPGGRGASVCFFLNISSISFATPSIDRSTKPPLDRPAPPFERESPVSGQHLLMVIPIAVYCSKLSVSLGEQLAMMPKPPVPPSDRYERGNPSPLRKPHPVNRLLFLSTAAPQRPVPQLSLPPYSSNTFPSRSVKPPPKPGFNSMPGAERFVSAINVKSAHKPSHSNFPLLRCMLLTSQANFLTADFLVYPLPQKTQDSLNDEWYIADISRPEAEAALRKINKDGTFLVRDSSRKTATHPYVLMVLYRDKVYNIQIRYQEQNDIYLLGTGLKGKEDFSSVADIIDYFQRTPLLLIDGKDRGSRNQCMLKYAAGHI